MAVLGKRLLLALVLSTMPTLLSAQVGAEPAKETLRAKYPAEWPAGPAKDSVPEWAAPGRIHFARWDGGRIETAKAMLSGWPGFNPPDPDRLFAMTNWYDTRTISLLRQAGINMVWVTFSNGFSIQTEQAHQEQVRRYIEACHRQGIHVMAYESIANMFWEDMFERVPESRDWLQIGGDGKPVPYGAGDYTKMGRVTRYMANLGNPAWVKYLEKRVDLAIDAGADGVIYDNNFSNHLVDVYQDIYRHGSARKKDFLLMGNFHQDTYVLNHLVNSMTTEDGVEPGLYDAAHVQQGRIAQEKSSLVSVQGGWLVNNIGLFRIHNALSDGWKPAMIEDGGRETGVRETTPMSPARQQLALAEAMSFSIGMELFVEGAFAQGLNDNDPKIMVIWNAIGEYNRFFAEHDQFYAGTRSLSPVAVVLDDRSESVPLLNGLAGRGVLFDVVYERDLSPERLAPYHAVALLTAQTVHENALSALKSFVEAGGRLFAAGDVAAYDETECKRPRPVWFGQKEGKGECIYYDRIPSLDELAKTLLQAGGAGPVQVEAPSGVCYNLVQEPKNGRTIVHLLNYTPKPADGIKVVLSKKYRNMWLISPDMPEKVQLVSPSGSPAEIKLPAVRVYSLLVLESTRPTPKREVGN
jgi:hypothetical protein